MQIKDLITVLLIPAIVLSASVPHEHHVSTPNSNTDIKKRIVGGEQARIEEFPNIVSIWVNGELKGSGTLLNSTTILTGAGNTFNWKLSEVIVYANSADSKSSISRKLASRIFHPNYNFDEQDYDVAILTLAKPIPDKLQIPYAVLPQNKNDPTAGTEITIAGWGSTSAASKDTTNKLMKVDVPVISRDTCQKLYKERTVSSRMFCATTEMGGKDACMQDNGGPAMKKSSNIQIGIISWGRSCADPQYPGVYTNLGDKDIQKFLTEHLSKPT